MRIGIITPAPPRSTHGNRITALRWARILKSLGHQVVILREYEGERHDLLIALHARRSYSSIRRFNKENPKLPVVVALTGTDLYRDIRTNQRARESLEVADRIVVLQPKAMEELRPNWRKKTGVIYQSVGDKQAARSAQSASAKGSQNKAEAQTDGNFDVCVIGHLRAVKDPFRTAMAARSLPGSSKIRVLQVGGAMTAAMANRASKEMCNNKRYRWLGEQPRSRVRRILETSRLCVLSSRLEGGANVLSEAIVASVPVLASRIDGNIGILGPDYPGYFAVGDTRQLARLLMRAESSPVYLEELTMHSRGLAMLVDSAREEQAWLDLISELTSGSSKSSMVRSQKR